MWYLSKVRTAAISKAKELGILGDAGNLLHFVSEKTQRIQDPTSSDLCQVQDLLRVHTEREAERHQPPL